MWTLVDHCDSGSICTGIIIPSYVAIEIKYKAMKIEKISVLFFWHPHIGLPWWTMDIKGCDILLKFDIHGQRNLICQKHGVFYIDFLIWYGTQLYVWMKFERNHWVQVSKHILPSVCEVGLRVNHRDYF